MSEVDPSQKITPARTRWYQRWRAWAAGAAALVAVAGAVAGTLAATSGTQTPGTPTPGATSSTQWTAASPPTTVSVALFTASAAEQEAKATYDGVIERLGSIQPFSAVANAEDQHVAVLAVLGERYGVGLPSSFPGQSPPATLTEACQIGVRTEQNLVALYGQLRSEVSGYPDVVQAFTNLQASARDSHLPAFQRCVTTTTPSVSSTADVALSTAWAAEQQAKATYDAVIAKFGAVAPFSRIADAEVQHIATVSTLAARYGVSLPSTAYSGEAAPETFTEACQVGVGTEQNLIGMYAQLSSEVSGYTDLTQAFSNLRAASESHLSAFQRCA